MGSDHSRALAILILASAITFGWIRLDVPLYYDEAYTVGSFAVLPPSRIVTDYSAPNNHIANSLMLHAWSRVIGDPKMIRPDAWVLRVPAALCFSLGVLAFFVAARRLISPDPVTAAAATALFACQPHALEYAGALRGYGPSLALMAALLALIARPVRGLFFGPALAVLVFLLNYMVPSNAWFTGATALALHFATRDPVEPAPKAASLVGLAAGFAATAAAYWPIRAQLRSFAGGGHNPLDAVTVHLSMLLEETGWGLPLPVAFALLATGAFVILRRQETPEARRAARFAVPFVLAIVPVAAILSPAGFARNYLPAHAGTTVLYAWAVIGLARAARPAIIGIFLTVALISGAVHLLTHQSDRQADRVMGFLRDYAHPAGIVIVGEDAELAAHRYYAIAYKMAIPVGYYKLFPIPEVQRTPEIWFLTSSPKERNDALAHYGIAPATWKSRGLYVRTIGKIRIEVLTARTLPKVLGARAAGEE